MHTLMLAQDRNTILHSLSAALDSGADCYMFVCRPPQVLPSVPRTELPDDRQEAAIRLLDTLYIPHHTAGYRQLGLAIPLFAENNLQSLSTELYPRIASELGCSDWRCVERSIRNAIAFAFRRRDPAVWAQFYLDGKKPPSNKRFIATLAELLH